MFSLGLGQVVSHNKLSLDGGGSVSMRLQLLVSQVGLLIYSEVIQVDRYKCKLSNNTRTLYFISYDLISSLQIGQT